MVTEVVKFTQNASDFGHVSCAFFNSERLVSLLNITCHFYVYQLFDGGQRSRANSTSIRFLRRLKYAEKKHNVQNAFKFRGWEVYFFIVILFYELYVCIYLNINTRITRLGSTDIVSLYVLS